MQATRAMSHAVKQRDKNMCVKCGETMNLTIDHVKPISEGGENKIENMQTLCKRCNELKSNNIPITFKQRLRFIWRGYERVTSIKKATLETIGISLKSYVSKTELESFVQIKLQGEVAKLTNIANDKVQKLINLVDTLGKNKSIEVTRLENALKLFNDEFHEYKIEQEKILNQQRNAYKLLVEHLGVEYIPETRKQEEQEQKIMVEVVELAHFKKIKKVK